MFIGVDEVAPKAGAAPATRTTGMIRRYGASQGEHL